MVCNFLIDEWENWKDDGQRTVITVVTHKTGDKEPATLVVDHTKAELLKR